MLTISYQRGLIYQYTLRALNRLITQGEKGEKMKIVIPAGSSIRLYNESDEAITVRTAKVRIENCMVNKGQVEIRPDQAQDDEVVFL